MPTSEEQQVAGATSAGTPRFTRRVAGWLRPGKPRRVLIGVVLAALVAVGVPAVTVGVPWWRDANMAPVHARIASGAAHTCAIASDGGVKCWGDNASGQLGSGTTVASSEPATVPGLTAVIALASGGDHTCALTSAGAVLCWGANAAGQVGDGSTDDRLTPVQVQGLTGGVLAIAASADHTCALMGDRSVRCWGDNGSGQLGTGDTKRSAIPVAVTDLAARVTAVAAGNGYTCVVFTGRTVRCWGDNSDGQLGVGDLAPRLRWEPVIGLPRTSVVSTGAIHTCAVTQDGVVMCWGSNATGQLGATMAATSASAPMALPDLTGTFSAVASGPDQTCALATSGSVTCWGGQAATPSADPSQARPIPSLTGVRELTVGGREACAATDHEVYCWGLNGQGQTTPVAIAGL